MTGSRCSPRWRPSRFPARLAGGNETGPIPVERVGLAVARACGSARPGEPAGRSVMSRWIHRIRTSSRGARWVTPLFVLAGGTAGMIGLAGCPTSGETPGANQVFMRGIAFDPPVITIKAGESVTWTNMDLVPHTATSGNPEDEPFGTLFRSKLLSRGETFTHTFPEAGEFVYFCEVHPTMMRDAKVIVEAP
ncbi:MAG: hypothetical protein D6788_00095 [Planctomycetota bacterium]|nr:MAG: hypothetical protein D6788_00095 [Planctomycetota bacterium]